MFTKGVACCASKIWFLGFNNNKTASYRLGRRFWFCPLGGFFGRPLLNAVRMGAPGLASLGGEALFVPQGLPSLFVGLALATLLLAQRQISSCNLSLRGYKITSIFTPSTRSITYTHILSSLFYK